MPFANKFPLEELLDALIYWYSKTSIVTIEYIVWEG